MHSERIAHFVNTNHYLFPVKHPLSTFDKLIYSDNKKIYLSHPISSPRQQILHTKNNIEVAQKLIGEISSLAQNLRISDVLFEPTAIDEYRFLFKYKNNNEELIIPKLMERWDSNISIDDLLFVKPNNSLSELGNEWKGRSEIIIKKMKNNDDLEISELNDLKVANGILELLCTNIRAQINSRDHKLVEQSDSIAVYRPFYSGKIARGVKEELDYHTYLVKYRGTNNIAYVLHPEKDEKCRILQNIKNLLMKWWDEKKITGKSNSFDELYSKFNNIFIIDELTKKTELAIGEYIEEIMKKFQIQFTTPLDQSSIGPEFIVDLVKFKEKRGSEIKKCFEEKYFKELHKSGYIDLLNIDMTPSQFADKIKNQNSKK